MTDYKLAELAVEAGVTERTIRYYSSLGLVPAPIGGGKNTHYDDTHLAALQQIKTLQAAGHSLEEIRRRMAGPVLLQTEMWESFPVSKDMVVVFYPSMPPEQREWWLREIAALAAKKDEYDD